ncbi:MAG: DUF4389 domain-containing protein [Ghiorsea sp.]|nr:DUF4389 domain-containing protein [Ghiorsea sp.]MDQ7057020.1 DUF4389 domain-containing protein [Ghiorsea sp.]
MSEENKPYDMNTIVKNKSVWIRLLYMLLFAFLYSAAEFVILAVVVYQFLHVLLTGGDKDERVANLGSQLSVYVYQILQFQTFNTEDKPFPMSDWPAAKKLTAEADKPKATRKRTTPRKPAAKKTTTRKPRAKKEEPKADENNPTDNTPPEDKPTS